jgi:hypothetical protein
VASFYSLGETTGTPTSAIESSIGTALLVSKGIGLPFVGGGTGFKRNECEHIHPPPGNLKSFCGSAAVVQTECIS